MATERLSMRKTREILRQKWLLGCSNRAVAQSVGVSVGAVGETLRRAREAGLTWGEVAELADDARRRSSTAPGDWPSMTRALGRSCSSPTSLTGRSHASR